MRTGTVLPGQSRSILTGRGMASVVRKMAGIAAIGIASMTAGPSAIILTSAFGLTGCSTQEAEINKNIKALGDEDYNVRWAAAAALKERAESNISPELKGKMVDPLISAFKDTKVETSLSLYDYQFRRGSLESADTEALVELAKSNISTELKGKIVDTFTIAALNNEEWWATRLKAVKSLAEIAKSNISTELRDKMAFPLIEVSCCTKRDEKEWIQAAAGRALAELTKSDIFSSPEMKDRLNHTIAASVDKDRDTRKRANQRSVTIATLNISSEIKGKIVDSFIAALGNEDINVREDAIWALMSVAKLNIASEIKGKMIDPLLAAVLKNEKHDWFLRMEATFILAKLAESNNSSSSEIKNKIVDSFITALGDKDAQMLAARALEEIAKLNISPELKGRIAAALNKAGNKGK
ncbi:MAG: hypothetical protein WC624_00590 [Candidatus Margulisiibacteriota bacterium]